MVRLYVAFCSRIFEEQGISGGSGDLKRAGAVGKGERIAIYEDTGAWRAVQTYISKRGIDSHSLTSKAVKRHSKPKKCPEGTT